MRSVPHRAWAEPARSEVRSGRSSSATLEKSVGNEDGPVGIGFDPQATGRQGDGVADSEFKMRSGSPMRPTQGAVREGGDSRRPVCGYGPRPLEIKRVLD